MVIPYISTHAWIESLNLTIANDWEPWFVEGQVAGLVSTLKFYNFSYLIFSPAIIKLKYSSFLFIYLFLFCSILKFSIISSIIICRYTMEYTFKKSHLTFTTVKARIIIHLLFLFSINE